MSCEEVSELLPAYALGLLDGAELDAVEAHLRQGSEHDDELVELRAVAFAMDRVGMGETPSPSPQLARRVEGIVTAQDGVRRKGRRVAVPLGFGAIAAAVALLLVFGAGWLAGSQLGGGDGEYEYVVQGAGGEVLEMEGKSGSDSVTVTMAGIEPAPEGSAYQLWAVRDDGWKSIGVCNTNENGWWRGDFAYDYEAGENVALTVEPEGGSESPTTEPVLRSEF